MSYPSLTISNDDETLIAEWDNRKIPTCRSMTVDLGIVVIPFSASIAWIIYSLITGSMEITGIGDAVGITAWLLFVSVGTLMIVERWFQRYTVERIRINGEHFCHEFVGRPEWSPKQWDLADITEISFGNKDEFGEAMSQTMLKVHRGRQSEMIAYWAAPDFQRFLLEKIQAHLDHIGSTIPVVNTNEAD